MQKFGKKLMQWLGPAGCVLSFVTAAPAANEQWLDLEGRGGAGRGMRIVLMSGDEEYRSEEALPMLAKILSVRHGFDCRVLFSFDAGKGIVDPNLHGNTPGMESLGSADLLIIATRFRELPPEQYAQLGNYLNAGKPVIGLRTATHAFTGDAVFQNLKWSEFGLKILGETWINHHGRHKREGTRGIVVQANASHPVLNSVADVFGPSDVYGIKNLTGAETLLLRGAVTETLDPASKPLAGPKNEPPMPLAWLHGYTAPNGTTKGRSLCTTMGASVDLLSEDLRRLIVNAVYHLTGLEVPRKANVALVDPFYPTFYGFRRDGWERFDMTPAMFGPGQSPAFPDPPGTPVWNFRDRPASLRQVEAKPATTQPKS